jgi:hypothetical protein
MIICGAGVSPARKKQARRLHHKEKNHQIILTQLLK